MNDTYTTIANAIIKQQESIIGPLAWSEADKVKGIQVDKSHLTIKGDGKQVLEDLVKQYETLFGQASVEVCKNAVDRLKSQLNLSELPTVLI